MQNITTNAARLAVKQAAKAGLRAMRGALTPQAMYTRRHLLYIAVTGMDIGLPSWAWHAAGYSRAPFSAYKTFG